MASQTIAWITLPNGFTGSRARLSVFVSPQLQPDPPQNLEPFDFVDWPARCGPGRIEFEVVFGGFRVRADIVSEPDSRVWKALFEASTFVRPYRPDATSGIFSSYRAAALQDDLKARYRRVCAISPIHRPTPDVVTDAFEDVMDLFGPASAQLLEDAALNHAQNRTRIARSIFRSGAMASRVSRLDRLVDLAREESEQSRSSTGRAKFVPLVPDTGTVADRFAQLAVFHRQPMGTVVAPASGVPDTRLDFHQMVTALGEYRELMRMLGLVIDLEIDLKDVPEAEPDAPALVHVAPKFLVSPSHAVLPLAPSTAYICKRGQFFTAADRNVDGMSREVVRGLLNLRLESQRPGTDNNENKDTADDDQFRLVQIDVDGAVLKALDLLDRISRARTDGAPPKNAALASLRSGGISIVRRDHARHLYEQLAASLERMAAPGGGGFEPLFANDLIRGFRIDVRRAGSDVWHSLHERLGTYEFQGFPELTMTLADEGYCGSSVAQPIAQERMASTSHDPNAPNYFTESLFLWQGWSLSVPRPGQSMPPVEVPPTPALPPTRLNLEVNFKVPGGSLPRLRFGERYEMRARVVDLAGNSLRRDEADSALTALGPMPPVLPRGDRIDPTKPNGFPFLRFEPVACPVAVFRSRPREGESVERIVLRSTPDTSPEAFVKAHPEFLNANERHIAPPKTFQLMAEMHGLFDASIGTGANHEQTHLLAAREDGSLSDGATPSNDEDNPVHPEPTLKITYLPDPLAAGVAFQNLPGVPEGSIGRATAHGIEIDRSTLAQDSMREIGSLLLVDFGAVSSWPDLQPFRLRLEEGTGVPRWNAVERLLTVFLAKGETRVVRMSCHLGEEAHPLLGIRDWVEGALPESRQLALFGALWMLTPHEDLTLVHAVPRPVEAPLMSDFHPPLRLRDRTFAYMDGKVHMHAGSAGRLELVASWTELIDDPVADKTESQNRRESVFAVDLPPSGIPRGPDSDATVSFDFTSGTLDFLAPPIKSREDSLLDALDALHTKIEDFARQVAILRPLDANLREIVFALRTTAAAARVHAFHPNWPDMGHPMASIAAHGEELENPVAPDLPPDVPDGLQIPSAIASAARQFSSAARSVAEIAQKAIDMVVRFRGVRHEFGDTKYRKVNYQTIVTTRFGDCFPPRLDGRELDVVQVSDEKIVDVPGSAPPPPPGIQYAVPAFAWTRPAQPASGDFRSERRGALRIYLDRPWYSSGEGEMLGVLIRPDSSTVPPEQIEPFVTRWGRDPLWRSPATAAGPEPEHFRNSAMVRTLPLHGEDAPALVTVVAYQVVVSDKRCFCDIELDPGDSYFPFVRLALARFQPNSLAGLSRVVLADFMPLTPNRTVTVTRHSSSRFDVAVIGRTHQTPANPIKRGKRRGTQVTVSVQTRLPGTTDEVGWIPAGGQVAVTPEVDAPSGELLWRGAVTLPAERQPGHFRLLLEEVEWHKSIGVDTATPVDIVVPRIVFAETVEI